MSSFIHKTISFFESGSKQDSNEDTLNLFQFLDSCCVDRNVELADKCQSAEHHFGKHCSKCQSYHAPNHPQTDLQVSPHKMFTSPLRSLMCSPCIFRFVES